MCTEFMKCVDSALFGSVFDLRRANKAVRAKTEECKVEHFKDDDRLKHPENHLNEYLTASIEHLVRIETKAMGTLLGVAVAVAVLGAAPGVLGAEGVFAGNALCLRIVAAVLLGGGMLFLFTSGFLALKAYWVGQVYRPTLFDRPPLAESVHEKMVILYCIEQNWRAATLRSNLLSACFTCLRNGLASVLMLGILIVITAS